MAEVIEGLEELNRRISEIAVDARHVKRPLISSAVYMLDSIEKNFQAQGRPRKWNPLQPSTLASRRKGNQAKRASKEAAGRGSRTLIDTARLKNSMDKNVTDTQAEIGTNVEYAKAQQFGLPPRTITAKNAKALSFVGAKGERRFRKSVRNPGFKGRPFLVVQPEDIREIGEIFSRHLRK